MKSGEQEWVEFLVFLFKLFCLLALIAGIYYALGLLGEQAIEYNERTTKYKTR
jgi:hypothetical protein